MWNPLLNHQCLALRDVRVPVRIGVHAFEREKPQMLSVDVEMYRQHERFAGGSLESCLDYDRVYYHLTRQLPAHEHVELLELLADGIVDICLEDARVEACRVVVRKLDVYPGTAVPEIIVFRHRPAPAGRAA